MYAAKPCPSSTAPATGRDRVLAAIRHRDGGGLPIDLGATRSSGITAIACVRLRRALGLPDRPVRVFDPLLQLAVVDEDLRLAVGGDAVALHDGFPAGWRPGNLPDGTPALYPGWFHAEPDGQGGEWCGRRSWHRPAGGHYFDPVAYPLSGPATIADLDRLDWREADDAHFDRLAVQARLLRQGTDAAIVAPLGGNFLEGGQWIRGMDVFLMDLAGDRVFAEALLDRLLRRHLANARRWCDAVGPLVDIVQFDDDLGSQHGPQLSPRLYRELIQPRQRELWSAIKRRCPHLSIMLHSCGDVRALIPGLADAGLDIINPVQISCPGMAPAALKRDFGDRMCFWGGGCDTQAVLPRGQTAEIRAHVAANIRAFSPGGGFVFAAVHNIQPDVPADSIVAMFAAARDARVAADGTGGTR